MSKFVGVWTQDWETYLSLSNKAMAIAERITAARRQRVIDCMASAGLGNEYHGCIYHNAFVALQTGRPWANTDAALIRRGHWLESHMFDADRIARDYSSKLYREFMAAQKFA